ncbi:MAG: hypothetical protein ACOX17_03515 [Christensenellales bacterium]
MEIFGSPFASVSIGYNTLDPAQPFLYQIETSHADGKEALPEPLAQVLGRRRPSAS